jgi:hypothetical protein
MAEYSDGNAAPPRNSAAVRDLRIHFDPWIAASTLQKAIRRGEEDVAVHAAFAYARMRGNGVWRRLLIIGFEDVGIGAPEVVIEAVDLCASALSSKERKLDHERLERLVRRMAGAPKDRSPDHLLTAATFSPRLDPARGRATARSASDQVAAAADMSASLLDRALAVTLALELDMKGFMRAGDLAAEAIFHVFRNLGVPAEVVTATRDAARLTREPITLMTPLLWLEAEQAGGRPVLAQAIPPSPSLGGVPAYALDKHTAAGKAAILRFARENKPVRDALSGSVDADRASMVAGMAVFHTEGSAIATRRLWDGALELERLGVEADMFKAGAHLAAADAILEVVRDNLDHLHAIRAQLFPRPARRTPRPSPFPTSPRSEA